MFETHHETAQKICGQINLPQVVSINLQNGSITKRHGKVEPTFDSIENALQDSRREYAHRPRKKRNLHIRTPVEQESIINFGKRGLLC